MGDTRNDYNILVGKLKGRRRFWDLDVDEYKGSKERGCWLDSAGSGWSPVAGYFKLVNEFSGSIKDRRFLEHLRTVSGVWVCFVQTYENYRPCFEQCRRSVAVLHPLRLFLLFHSCACNNEDQPYPPCIHRNWHTVPYSVIRSSFFRWCSVAVCIMKTYRDVGLNLHAFHVISKRCDKYSLAHARCNCSYMKTCVLTKAKAVPLHAGWWSSPHT